MAGLAGLYTPNVAESRCEIVSINVAVKLQWQNFRDFSDSEQDCSECETEFADRIAGGS